MHPLISTFNVWITDFGQIAPTPYEREQVRRMRFCKTTREPRKGSRDWHLYRYMLASANTRAHLDFVTLEDEY
jgi:hypothetical protein